jgi:hypothetical protein
MADEDKDGKVEELTARIQALTATVEELSSRLSVSQSPSPPSLTTSTEGLPEEENTADLSEVTEEVLAWVGKAALLPRLSTLCFLLVIALGLRTLTDNGIVGTLNGSALGMGYAALLMVAGWRLYSNGSPLAPVLAACGAALMPIVVVETHSRFQSLPLVPAYLTLMATGIFMTLISNRFRVFTPISTGTLGMCLAGAAIDYPTPFFPYLAMVLLTANILAFYAIRIRRSSWLRWIVLIVTIFMLQLWATRLTMQAGTNEWAVSPSTVALFPPVLVLFAASYFALSLLGIIRSGAAKAERIDCALPVINCVWVFSLAIMTADSWGGGKVRIGLFGTLFALVNLGVGYWIAERIRSTSSGINAFAFAGITLLALAFPHVTGNFLFSLPVVSAAAIFLFFLSSRWNNGGTRITSYLGQLYAVAAMVIIIKGDNSNALGLSTLIPTGLLAIISFCHYLLARRYLPSGDSGFMIRFDRRDRSALFIFVASLFSLFFFLRICLYQILMNAPVDLIVSFRCAQSIIVNIGAATLMLIAAYRHNREIRNVAILLTLVGGVKVFIFDLLGTHGMPLVLSVFTFGIVAAIESILLGRWHREKVP